MILELTSKLQKLTLVYTVHVAQRLKECVILICIIRESVDSLCRHGEMHNILKQMLYNFTTNTLKLI